MTADTPFGFDPETNLGRAGAPGQETGHEDALAPSQFPVDSALPSRPSRARAAH